MDLSKSWQTARTAGKRLFVTVLLVVEHRRDLAARSCGDVVDRWGPPADSSQQTRGGRKRGVGERKIVAVGVVATDPGRRRVDTQPPRDATFPTPANATNRAVAGGTPDAGWRRGR